MKEIELIEPSSAVISADFIGFFKAADEDGSSKCRHIACGFKKHKQIPMRVTCDQYRYLAILEAEANNPDEDTAYRTNKAKSIDTHKNASYFKEHKAAGCKLQWCRIKVKRHNSYLGSYFYGKDMVEWPLSQPTKVKDLRPRCRLQKRVLHSDIELASPDVTKFEAGIRVIVADLDFTGGAVYGIILYDLNQDIWSNGWWEQREYKRQPKTLVPHKFLTDGDKGLKITSVKLINDVVKALKEKIL